jgi:SAM-dependent methyltransferase
MVDPDFDKVHADLLGTFDTVFALNVVEHIEDHRLAMSNASRLLKPGGNLIILVPAYQSLYNHFDKDLGHFRRFTKKTLRSFIPTQLIQETKMTYFNFVGIFGWYVSGKLMGNKQISADSMRTYNRLMPIIKLADKVMMGSMGLSVWFVAQKK